MNSNDNQPIPSDYLDQIAPQAPRKTNFLVGRPIIIGGLVITIIVITLMTISSLSGGAKPTEQLAARLVATESITDGATSNIKSTQLRALNSNLKIYLTDAVRDIGPLLIDDNINIKKLDKKVVLAESSTEMLATLEDARLNAIYDRTYAREMAYKLDTILTLMRQIYGNTKNKDLKSFLGDKIENLEPTQKQFADFNAANS